MAFEILIWLFFGAIIALLAVWSSAMSAHWFEALAVGMGGAFLGGMLFEWTRAEGPRIGSFDVLSLLAAIVGACALLAIDWAVRYGRSYRAMRRH